MTSTHLTHNDEYKKRKNIRKRHKLSRKISKGFRRVFALIFLLNLLIIITYKINDIHKDSQVRTYNVIQNSNNIHDLVINLNKYNVKYVLINTDTSYVNKKLVSTNYTPKDIINEFNRDILSSLNRVNWVFKDMQNLFINNTEYKLYSYVTIGDIVDEIITIESLVLLGSIIALMILGNILIISYSTLAAKRVTKPIRDITKLTNDITFHNLNMRLDVDVAQKELRELIETINSMLDRIYTDYKKHRRFVSDVSHELRTPLSVIDGYANMLNRWAKDDQHAFDESVTAIIDESKNMKLLVENLLLLARHDNKTTTYKMEKINLSDMIQDVYRETLLVDDNKHEITSNITPDIFIIADEHKIKQSIRIFVANALQYTPDKNSIEIKLSIKNGKAVTEVRDTGIGISQKDLPHIFDRFYRSDESRNKRTGGHGLGLALAKAIIKDHGGKIIVRSAIDKGTIVRIQLNVKK